MKSKLIYQRIWPCRFMAMVFLLVFQGTQANGTLTDLKNNNDLETYRRNMVAMRDFQTTITGSVSDSDGTPLPGATVIEKGTTNGVQTDFDGNFSIDVSQTNAILMISYIGFASQEVSIGNQTFVTITLQEDTAKLDEVVVVGYGAQKKSDLTGSVGTLDAEKIQKRITINPLDNLQGQVAGVNVFNSSGRPGGGFRVTIRGKGSLNANNEPLYVVDGIIGVDIDLINPNDIESFTVLKDASATAIYGARGANGVILITTKRGKSGKFTVDIVSNLQIGRAANKPEVLNSDEYWNDLKVRLDADQRALGVGDASFVNDYPITLNCSQLMVQGLENQSTIRTGLTKPPEQVFPNNTLRMYVVVEKTITYHFQQEHKMMKVFC